MGIQACASPCAPRRRQGGGRPPEPEALLCHETACSRPISPSVGIRLQRVRNPNLQRRHIVLSRNLHPAIFLVPTGVHRRSSSSSVAKVAPLAVSGHRRNWARLARRTSLCEFTASQPEAAGTSNAADTSSRINSPGCSSRHQRQRTSLSAVGRAALPTSSRYLVLDSGCQAATVEYRSRSLPILCGSQPPRLGSCRGARSPHLHSPDSLGGTMMKTAHSESKRPPSQQKKPNTSPASAMLSESEIANLQKRKRELSAYARKAFSGK